MYHHHPGNWDQDKVQRVLEGKAVLRVVDVEQPPMAAAASVPAPTASVVSAATPSSSPNKRVQDEPRKKCATAAAVCDILEESMRSLSLGKGA